MGGVPANVPGIWGVRLWRGKKLHAFLFCVERSRFLLTGAKKGVKFSDRKHGKIVKKIFEKFLVFREIKNRRGSGGGRLRRKLVVHAPNQSETGGPHILPKCTGAVLLRVADAGFLAPPPSNVSASIPLSR